MRAARWSVKPLHPAALEAQERLLEVLPLSLIFEIELSIIINHFYEHSYSRFISTMYSLSLLADDAR